MSYRPLAYDDPYEPPPPPPPLPPPPPPPGPPSPGYPPPPPPPGYPPPPPPPSAVPEYYSRPPPPEYYPAPAPPPPGQDQPEDTDCFSFLKGWGRWEKELTVLDSQENNGQDNFYICLSQSWTFKIKTPEWAYQKIVAHCWLECGESLSENSERMSNRLLPYDAQPPSRHPSPGYRSVVAEEYRSQPPPSEYYPAAPPPGQDQPEDTDCFSFLKGWYFGYALLPAAAAAARWKCHQNQPNTSIRWLQPKPQSTPYDRGLQSPNK
ncbi:hypothetical protein HS088_TW10G00195 [Tripterygium wilfordii]|uniref:Uncharacterized protein n=1 Tax=Tripterygium wilfordii TaxID=458696 RepID=A0A7J7D4D9_TRIWF|nr:hypothetical protein HS088_TW10G00195 [Tripterygium wilfordii]